MTSSLCGFSILSLAFSLSTFFSGDFLSVVGVLVEDEDSISILLWLASRDAGNWMRGAPDFDLAKDGVYKVGLFLFQVKLCGGDGSGDVAGHSVVPEVVDEILENPVQEVGHSDDKQVVGYLHVLEGGSVVLQVLESSSKSFAGNSPIYRHKVKELDARVELDFQIST
jgi:hypothetical protein